MRKRIIGVTGRAGSGKTVFARALAKELKAFHIAADETGHEALDACKDELIERFGKRILNEETGAINRTALGAIVFENENERIALEAIVHPYMVNHIVAISENTIAHVIIDAALLFRMGLNTICRTVIYITAPEDVCIKRLMHRTAMPQARAKAILANQKDVKESAKRADIIIENTEDVSFLSLEAARIARMMHENEP